MTLRLAAALRGPALPASSAPSAPPRRRAPLEPLLTRPLGLVRPLGRDHRDIPVEERPRVRFAEIELAGRELRLHQVPELLPLRLVLLGPHAGELLVLLRHPITAPIRENHGRRGRD